MATFEEIEAAYGRPFFDWQKEPILDAAMLRGGAGVETHRSCLFYRTGAGKSVTSLGMVAVMGYDECLVIAPPSTHVDWCVLGEKLGVRVEAISHAKFRQKKYQLSRSRPVIADEFHMFGGHGGAGWKKLDGLARGLRAPLVLASATPNYNDAERCYCVQHILDPLSCRGGYLEFLYRECETEANPFSMTPKVLGFRNFPEAKDYLAALPGVYYLPDDLVYTIEDRQVPIKRMPELDEFGLDMMSGRIMASQIEEKHLRIKRNLLLNSEARTRNVVWQMLMEVFDEFTNKDSFLIYCTHSSIAEILYEELVNADYPVALVTGDTSKNMKDVCIAEFKLGNIKILVGTATLGTGTDGLDQVCDTLIIFDDTEDDAARRQLIGRIMPRGAASNTSKKRVIRFVQ